MDNSLWIFSTYAFDPLVIQIVDTKRMNNTYKNDEYFRTFVKHATAISSLPSDKLIDGFDYLQEEFNFEEENKQKFKIEFLIYIKEY